MRQCFSRLLFGLLVSLVAALLLPVAASAAPTFSDGTFSNADWTAPPDYKILDDTAAQSGTFTASQVSTGGSPLSPSYGTDAYRRVTHDWDGPGNVIFAHLKLSAIWDPATSGSFNSLHFAFDLNDFNTPSVIGFFGLIRQNGSFYVFPPITVASANQWTHFETGEATAADFQKIGSLGTGGPSPDFSASAAPIQFGFASSNGAAFAEHVHTDGGIDNWAVFIKRYTTPVGASPLRVSLVPTFTPCNPASADTTHAAPLSSPSCSNPQQTSSTATVGPNSLGFARMVVCPQGVVSAFCNPSPAGSMPLPDFRLTGSIRDVRCKQTGTPSGCVAGQDYDPNTASGPYTSGGGGTVGASPPCLPSGTSNSDCAVGADLTERIALQITDTRNGPGQNTSATTAPLDYAIPIDCLPTSDPTQGSTCGVNTTANALAPGAVVAGGGAIWRTPNVRIYDSGPNGTRGDGDDELFEAQGVFGP